MLIESRLYFPEHNGPNAIFEVQAMLSRMQDRVKQLEASSLPEDQIMDFYLLRLPSGEEYKLPLTSFQTDPYKPGKLATDQPHLIKYKDTIRGTIAHRTVTIEPADEACHLIETEIREHE